MEFLKSQQMGEKGKEGHSKSSTEKSKSAEVLMEGFIEKVGMFAMEKQSISVDAVKENFSIGKEQAESVIKQLETIGVLGKVDVKGEHKVILNMEAFQNRIKGYQSLAARIRTISASKNTNLSDITISKKLIMEENAYAVKTRVPGSWGKFLWIRKDHIMEIHGGKTMLTFLDKEKMYKIYNEKNRVVETCKGERLYSTHYDKVEAAVREQYAKTKVQKEKKTKTSPKRR
jgi:ribosomal protein S25